MPVRTADLPQDVLALLAHHLDLAGTYGDPEAGEPIQDDELRIEHDQGDVEIVVYSVARLRQPGALSFSGPASPSAPS